MPPPRCPKGTRRNKKTGNCEEKREKLNVNSTKKRCPNGTRRNNKTGNCESRMKPMSPKVKVSNKVEKLRQELVECEEQRNAAYHKFNSTQSGKEYKIFIKLRNKCMKLEDAMYNADTNLRLTEEEADKILHDQRVDEEDEEYDELKEKLMNLTYDKKYMSDFTGKPTRNLYNMAQDKLSSYYKYGSDI